MTDSLLQWIPRFEYGAASADFTYPITRWDPGARTVGRSLTSATGIPGVSLQLRKYTLSFDLRFTETEWPDIIDLFAFAQSGRSFLWFPRSYDETLAESFEVWLEAPRVAAGVKPRRDESLLWLFTLAMTISRTSAPWELQYFRT